MDNIILGNPKKTDTSIQFKGKGNVLFCEDGVTLEKCFFCFAGDNSLIYLSKSVNPYKLSVTIFHDSTVFFGENNYFNSMLSISVSERKHIFFGNGNMVSYRVECRTADPHLIYDFDGKRINPSKSVFVGDHVWIGAECFLLKGTRIHSGSILGAKTVTSKELCSNAIFGGLPVRLLKKDIFWDGGVVHAYRAPDTSLSMDYASYCDAYKKGQSENFKFEFCDSEYVPFEMIEESLEKAQSVQERINYLSTLPNSKNRFAYFEK